MDMFMEYLVPLIGIFIGNLLLNGFVMWLVITKIVGSSEDATFLRCVVCCFIMFLVMIVCLFVLLFPFLGGIIYLVCVYKLCITVIETTFELPDGRGRGILILFLIANFGVGWVVDKGLESAQTGITYAQQGYMSQAQYVAEFEKQLNQRLEGNYVAEYNGDYDGYYDVEVYSPNGRVSIEFEATDFYRTKVDINEAVNRVERLMDALTGRKPEPSMVVAMEPDAPQPPTVSPDAPQAPQPPADQDDDVAVAPRPRQPPMAPQAPQPSQAARPLAGTSTEQSVAAKSLSSREATLKKVFNIEGDIPSLGISCEYYRGAPNDDEEW